MARSASDSVGNAIIVPRAIYLFIKLLVELIQVILAVMDDDNASWSESCSPFLPTSLLYGAFPSLNLPSLSHSWSFQ